MCREAHAGRAELEGGGRLRGRLGRRTTPWEGSSKDRVGGHVPRAAPSEAFGVSLRAPSDSVLSRPQGSWGPLRAALCKVFRVSLHASGDPVVSRPFGGEGTPPSSQAAGSLAFEHAGLAQLAPGVPSAGRRGWAAGKQTEKGALRGGGAGFGWAPWPRMTSASPLSPQPWRSLSPLPAGGLPRSAGGEAGRSQPRGRGPAGVGVPRAQGPVGGGRGRDRCGPRGAPGAWPGPSTLLEAAAGRGGQLDRRGRRDRGLRRGQAGRADPPGPAGQRPQPGFLLHRGQWRGAEGSGGLLLGWRGCMSAAAWVSPRDLPLRGRSQPGGREAGTGRLREGGGNRVYPHPLQDTEILDSAMYRSRANLGRKRGHRAPAIRPGGTLGLSEAAASDARLFQDSTGREVSVSLPRVRRAGLWGCRPRLSPCLGPCRATGFAGAVLG